MPPVMEVLRNLLSYASTFFMKNPSKNVTLKNLPSLLQACETNAEILKKKLNNQPKKKREFIVDLLETFDGIKTTLKTLGPMVEDIRAAAPSFDFSEKVPANGYRSFVSIADQAAATADRVIRECPGKVSSWDFTYREKLLEVLQLLKSLARCFTYLEELKSKSSDGSLYPSEGITVEELIELGQLIDQECFFGRLLAFYFEPSFRMWMRRISFILTSYSELYYGSCFFRAVARMVLYACDEVSRGRRHVALMHHSGVEFLQSFWNLAEHPAMVLTMELTNRIAVSQDVILPQRSVIVDGVEVTPSFPYPPRTKGRLISSHVRQGMDMAGEGALPASRGLVIHVHSGGFVAQSAKAQEFFLRKWAHRLDVPIFSIDYSLSPGSRFPRAAQEVFYAYCVALSRASRLGSTAERVVFAGESAGANLILAAVQECIARGVRLPDGLFLAYVPVLVSFVPSPARILGVLDPMLPYGFMLRCAKAYVLGEESIEERPPISTCTCQDCSKISHLSYLDNPHLVFPKEAYLLDVPEHPYINPYNASDEVLRKLPPTSLYGSTFDPCLDDTIMFAKKLRRLGNSVHLNIVEGLPHGFFNMCWVNNKVLEATREGAERISSLLDLSSLPPSNQ